MSSRERVLTAMHRRVPDRVPFALAGFAPFQLDIFRKKTGAEDPYEYFGCDIRGVGIGPTRLHADFSRYHPALPPRAIVDEWGIGHLPTESTDAHHSHLEGYLYPMLQLKTRQDVLDYPLPDIEADYRYTEVAHEIERIKARGLCATCWMACTIFEIAWYMRSMELLMMDFVDNAEFAEALLDRITVKREIQAWSYAELGADMICLGDDVGSQRGLLLSKPMWQRWLKPRLARIIGVARMARPDVLIFYHSDGDIRPIIPDLIEIGVDILNPIQPECMDPAELKKKYGHRLAFWGTIGIQTTLPFGTPEDVRREVKMRIETVGEDGGLLIAPTHVIEPEVPWENILAFVEAVHEFGLYR
jgi:uroporphyrinogen decarboxylase